MLRSKSWKWHAGRYSQDPKGDPGHRPSTSSTRPRADAALKTREERLDPQKRLDERHDAERSSFKTSPRGRTELHQLVEIHPHILTIQPRPFLDPSAHGWSFSSSENSRSHVPLRADGTAFNGLKVQNLSIFQPVRPRVEPLQPYSKRNFQASSPAGERNLLQ